MTANKFALLQFIQTPKSFLGTAADSELWQQGLTITQDVTKNDVIQLRPAQVEAWEGMTKNQLGLLLGPPGTGKTFTISAMACGLLSACTQANRPCRIFVTGFTRNSIENVLEYIKKFSAKYPQMDFEMAYDRADLIDEEDDKKNIPMVNKYAFLSFLDVERSVFGGTVWTLFKILDEKRHLPKGGHPQKHLRQAPIFDFLIIDEASQVQFTHGLMAMAGMKDNGRILVCGDDKQLSPIFDAKLEIEDNAAEKSIYDYLISHDFPEFALNETFRLNEPLVEFVSQEYYAGNYISAEPIRNRTIKYRAKWAAALPQWQQTILDPQIPFVALVHDGIEAGKQNPDESQIVLSLVQSLYNIIPKSENFWEEEIAVISPHRMNNEHLREMLEPITGEPYVDTVDRFQGRERNCIIYSMCVSDPEFAQHEPNFLYQPNRLNVGITRARSKLIFIVSKNILQPMLREDEDIENLSSFRRLIFSAQELGKVELERKDEKNLALEIYGKAFTTADIERAKRQLQEGSQSTLNN